MIKVKKFTFNPFQENTYIISNEKKECIIIDPGCSNFNEEKEFNFYIENNNLSPKYLLNTHCHIDHILGNNFIKSNWDVKFGIHKLENELLKNSKTTANNYGIEVHAGHGLDYKTTKILTKINEIEEFNIGHFLIGESVFDGLPKVIKNFKRILKHRNLKSPNKVIFGSGKIIVDLLNDESFKNIDSGTEIVSLEQLYPFPLKEITEILKNSNLKEIIWLQEEPRNRGA